MTRATRSLRPSAGVPRAVGAERAAVPLDNAAIIFLATRSEIDPKVFRLSAELDHDVDAVLVQRALDATFDRYPLFHAVVRRGRFWYSLEDSDLRPLVTAESGTLCAPIYRTDRATLLFRVLHQHRRIVLETFHALTDGIGASWFLSDLVAAYVRLSGSDSAERGDTGSTVEEDDRVRDLAVDSFATTFRRHGRARSAIEGAIEGAEESGSDASTVSASRPPRGVRRILHPVATSTHHIAGPRPPDGRPRVIELSAPVDEVLALARDEGVSLTMYLTAMFFESIRSVTHGLGRRHTLSASVAVDLRRVFPSTSARNFFAAVRVEHTGTGGEEDLGTICRLLQRQFDARTTPRSLATKVRRFVAVEELAVVRGVPRRLKDPILGVIGWAVGRRATVAVSNLGRVVLPAPADDRVGRIVFHVRGVRPQIAVVSHAGLLTITFTSPFTSADHVGAFIRSLAASGVGATVTTAQGITTERAQVDT